MLRCQGQLLRSDATFAQLVDQEAVTRTAAACTMLTRLSVPLPALHLPDFRKAVMESVQDRAYQYVSARERESRPKALAIAAFVVLCPILLAIPQLLLAFRVGSVLDQLGHSTAGLS